MQVHLIPSPEEFAILSELEDGPQDRPGKYTDRTTLMRHDLIQIDMDARWFITASGRRVLAHEIEKHEQHVQDDIAAHEASLVANADE